ncbi:MAG: glycosyltransferase family 2 protein [Bacteroidota bacterium]|nr:glycosyltransferase family 2 protein [Bacteroidota bacterium]MDP4196271.1 glycosyltransferase family 2 protein [Bacteroidota bacterium]
MTLIFWLIFPFVFAVLIVSLYNMLTAPRMLPENCFGTEAPGLPLISLLIPARNEEENIARCLELVSKQNYNNLEIIVLNDNSDDRTLEIASGFALADSRIRIIHGQPLEKPWLGKNWACHQLSQNASGSLLLFIDADVRLSPDAVHSAALKMKKYDLGMLSVFPGQIMGSIGEYLIVPMMNWLLLSFLPLRKVFTSAGKSFAAANGQFIMMTKEAYAISGGHKAAAAQIVEDMELARKIKMSGLKLMTLLGGNMIRCRMYRNFSDAFTGFSKNFFAGFKIPAFYFIIMLLMMEAAFLYPFLPALYLPEFALLSAMILISRIFISASSGQNILFNILLHPLQMLLVPVIGINSVFVKRKNKVIWKGRIY